jgi:tetrahydromethanopterin S-methyltransferase subunit G
MYVEQVHGAVYDIRRLQQEGDEKLAATKGLVWRSRELINSERAHRCFDELSGVTPPNRCADDLIDPSIFAKINARLKRLESIVDHVNTHVAHAGNKESRQGKALEKFDTQDAQKTLKQLKEVSSLIGVLFANESSSDLATSLSDQFEDLDRPIVSSAEIEHLEKHWESIESEIAGWRVRVEEL